MIIKNRLKNIFTILIFIIPFIGIAQKQGNIWYFEGNNGIDFNSGTPVLLTNGQIPITANIEGTATISDSSGNLLFYATAQNIWNKNHQSMSNGALMGGESATQGVFIVPLPNSDSIFYVFSLDEMQNCFFNGLRYSIVNMCLDNGFGNVDVMQKNILLLDTAGEKLACTFHSNGTDIWLVVHKYYSDAFYSYLITANGISDTIISHVGSFHPSDSTINCMESIGQMKISPDGSKLALVTGNDNIHSIEELFDFDNNSGIVSNVINLQPDSTYNYYGVSFSPDNSKLYISKLTTYQLYQYDLSSGIPSTIIASKTIIHNSNSPITGLQLGPDGKIYVVVGGTGYLDVITNPNNTGSTCDYISQSFNLIHSVPYSLPNFIDSYNYKNQVPNCKTDGINEIHLTDITISPNPVKNNLIIETQQIVKESTLTISNISGQELIRQKLVDTKTQIDISNLTNGIYFVKFITDKTVEVKKIIKE